MRQKILSVFTTIGLSGLFAYSGMLPAGALVTVTPTTDLVNVETNSLTPTFSVTSTQVSVGSPTDYHLRSMRFTPGEWTPQICATAVTDQPLTACGATLYKDGVALTDVTITTFSNSKMMLINFPAADYPAGWSLPAGTVWELEFAAGAFRTSESIAESISWSQHGNRWVTDQWASLTTLDTGSLMLPQNHVVIFNANGGTGSLERQLGRSDAALRFNDSTITRSGYTFEGWATSLANANAGTVAYVDGATFPFGDNGGTLYAVWQRIGSNTTEELAATGSGLSTTAGFGLTAIVLGLVAAILRLRKPGVNR